MNCKIQTHSKIALVQIINIQIDKTSKPNQIKIKQISKQTTTTNPKKNSSHFYAMNNNFRLYFIIFTDIQAHFVLKHIQTIKKTTATVNISEPQ